MNREIKYRGKTKSDGLWEFGSLLIENDKYYIYGTDNNWWEVIPETIGQCTGLKDIKGKEMIYEGDIVKVGDDYEVYGLMASEVREVYFGYGGFRLKSKNPEYKGCWLEDGKDVEIIGNIYDNPELLEVNNE